jgi:hypothetical protein
MFFDIPYRAGLGVPLEVGDHPKIIHTDFASPEDTTIVLAETEQDLDPDYTPSLDTITRDD